MTTDQAVNRQADHENLIRELIEALKLANVLSSFPTTGDAKGTIAKVTKAALEKAQEQGYA